MKNMSASDLSEFLKGNNARYRQLMNGTRPDYAPFRFWADDFAVCSFSGVDHRKFMTDFQVQLESQRAFNARFYGMHGYSVYAGIPDLYYDAERFGADFPNAHPGQFLEAGLENFDKYYQRRKVADLPGVKRFREGLEFYRRNLPPEECAAYYLGAWGAMDLFSVFRGTELFFLDLYDSPQDVARIFEYLTERSLEMMAYAEEHFLPLNGDNVLYDKVDVGEDYCAYLPPDLFDEFVTPYTGRLFEHYKGRAWRSLHTDGDIHIDIIHKLGETGCDELMGFSPNIDIAEFRKALPNTVLAGNIHPLKVMVAGTPEDVKNAARYCFETAAGDGKFVLCTGGAMSDQTRPENIDAFFQAAFEICKY